jgi:hypothetical protein
LFRQGLAAGRRARDVEAVTGAVAAAEAAIRSVRPGDLVLVQVDLVDETVELVRRRLAEARERNAAAPEAAKPRPRPAVAAAGSR